jgi:hypothetical protein
MLDIYLRLAELTLQVIVKVIEGQTPEQRKILWDWYIADMARLRKLLKLDEPPA